MKIDEVINGRRVITKKPELLIPAGDLEKLKIAVSYGADAVFVGGQQYSLRSRANNFSIEQIAEGCEFAQKHGSKVYVTCNIFAHNEDMAGVDEYLISLENAGVTGVIVADPYIASRVKEVASKLELHISTQQSITNYQAVKLWEDFGAMRVVGARELTKPEIKAIKDNCDAELEIFIHGAMCISYSGRCTMSNHMTAKDSNRGGCTQACRWEYDFYDDEKLINDEETHKFAFAAKDLVSIKDVIDMIELGVDSLKIEGRMKSIHYVATTTMAYRKLIDDYCNDPDNFKLTDYYINELNKCANREFTPQFFNENDSYEWQNFNQRDEHPTQEFIGIVKDYDAESQTAIIEQRNNFKVGYEIEFFGPQMDNFNIVIDEMTDGEDNLIDVARHPRQTVKMKVPHVVRANDMIRWVK